MYTYNLYYSGWEDYSPNLFTHEKHFSEEEFKGICDSLIPAAIGAAIKERPDAFVSWEDIVRYMTRLLPEHGFVPLRPVAQGYCGSIIIDSANISECDSKLPEEVVDLVVRHNSRINEERIKDWEERYGKDKNV